MKEGLWSRRDTSAVYLSGWCSSLYRVLPTFALIGAMKAGTTTISAVLDSHPDVFMCSPKEPQFFTTRWARGIGWYESLFARAGDAIARGDASTSYTDYPRKPEAAERMATVTPDALLVYVVRDPIQRMRSHYRHRVADGLESRPVEVALLDDRYVLRSCYGLQVQQYLRYFAREQLLVLDGADLLGGGPSWQQLFSFLGVQALVPTVNRANDTDARMRLRPGTRALRQRLRHNPVYAMAPAGLRAAVRRMGTRQPSSNDAADITPDLRAQLSARLDDDAQLLRELSGLEVSVS